MTSLSSFQGPEKIFLSRKFVTELPVLAVIIFPLTMERVLPMGPPFYTAATLLFLIPRKSSAGKCGAKSYSCSTCARGNLGLRKTILSSGAGLVVISGLDTSHPPQL